jgi:hypothetical protein
MKILGGGSVDRTYFAAARGISLGDGVRKELLPCGATDLDLS